MGLSKLMAIGIDMGMGMAMDKEMGMDIGMGDAWT
jgi:hypothetical protein